MALRSTDGSLVDEFDLAMLDLDGVVYLGARAVRHAPESLAAARAGGLHLAYITNNASRTPADVAEKLSDLGLGRVDPADVVTSAQAVARLIARQVPGGSHILVVGGIGLRAALEEHGLRPVDSLDDRPVAIVQGFTPELDWARLAEGTHAVQAGLPWFASNLDLTLPTPRGQAPGNGSFVRLIARITGRRPIVAGKPETALFEETVLRVGGRRPIVVGDRLDTDILGARKTGLPSLLVLTGVTDLDALVHAQARPDLVSLDLRGLLERHPPVHIHGDTAECGEAKVQHEFGRLRLRTPAANPTCLLRAITALSWSYLDRGGDALDMGEAVRAVDEMMTS